MLVLQQISVKTYSFLMSVPAIWNKNGKGFLIKFREVRSEVKKLWKTGILRMHVWFMSDLESCFVWALLVMGFTEWKQWLLTDMKKSPTSEKRKRTEIPSLGSGDSACLLVGGAAPSGSQSQICHSNNNNSNQTGRSDTIISNHCRCKDDK